MLHFLLPRQPFFAGVDGETPSHEKREWDHFKARSNQLLADKLVLMEKTVDGLPAVMSMPLRLERTMSNGLTKLFKLTIVMPLIITCTK